MKPNNNQKAQQELSIASSVLNSEQEIKAKTAWFNEFVEHGKALAEMLRKEAETYKDDKPTMYHENILKALNQEADNKAKQQFLDFWKERGETYARTFAEVSTECKANYETVYNRFNQVAKNDLRLQSFISGNNNDPSKETQKTKNKFYLLMKLELVKADKMPKLEIVD